MVNTTTFLKGALAFAMSLCGLTAAAAVNYVADPDPANKVEELSKVTLTFPDATEVDMGSKSANVTVTSGDFSRGCTLAYGEDSNQMTVSFTKITTEGVYDINFPADAITADGVALEAFTITYTVGVDVADNSTLIPAPGEVKWLFDIVYENPDVEFNLSVESSAAELPVIVDPEGNTDNLKAIYDYQVGNGKYRFQLRRLYSAPGEYTVKIPENYIYYTDASYTKVYLPAKEFKYTVTGGELTKVESNPSLTEPTSNFNQLTLTFPGYETIAVKELSYAEKTVYVYMEGMENAMCQLSVEAGSYGFVIDGNSMSYTNQYSDYITPGRCYMTFPEGSILLGEEQTPCTPFMVEFEIKAPEPVAINVDPAEGSTVSMLAGATVSFPEIAQVDPGRSPSITLYEVYTEDGEEKTKTIGGAYTQSQIERLSDNSFKVNFNGLATESGDYRINIRENSFTYEGGFNQAYSVDVKFEAPEAPAFTIIPGTEETLSKIQSFVISFPDESVVKVNNLLSNKDVKLYKGEQIEYNDYGAISNAQIGSASTFTPMEGTDNVFSFMLGTAALEAGKYVLRIPAGIFLMGETPVNFNAAVDLVYECNGEGIDKIEVTPSEPVKSLKDISIKFIDQTEVTLQSEYTGFTLYREKEGQDYGEYLVYLSGDNTIRTEGNVLYITLPDAYTEAGRYYIDISAYSLFMSDGVTPSTPQCVYFTVDPNGPSGVEGIKTEELTGRIFTISGVDVKDMTAPGIYVKDGKKVIVR